MSFRTEEQMWARFERERQPISYVYMVYDENGRPVYVGRGKDARLHQSQRKHGVRVEVISDGLTNDEAKDAECILIRILGRAELDQFGILRNRQWPRPRTSRLAARNARPA